MKKFLTIGVRMISVVAAIVGISSYAYPQYRSEIDVQQWPAGKVVLMSGDTIYGPLTFFRTEDVVNIQNSDGTVSAFSPVNVQYFVTQEQPSGRTLVFRTLLWDMGRDYNKFKKPTFFEQLNQGPFTLLMREAYTGGANNYANGPYGQQQYNNPYYYPMGSQTVEVVKELYYVLLPDGNVVTLRNVRKDLHRLFGAKSKQVKSYAKVHHLEYERPHELIAIVNYFNMLQRPKLQVADLEGAVTQHPE
jgi:hypothetical protein